MRRHIRIPALLLITTAVILIVFVPMSFAGTELSNASAQQPASQATGNTRFEISFPTSLHAEPITGRVFLFISRSQGSEPRFQPPVIFLGTDVRGLRPGEAAAIDAATPGAPAHNLAKVPAGEAVLNVYTEFHRADGHVVLGTTPVIYLQGHFSLDGPFGFTTEPDKPGTKSWARQREEWPALAMQLYHPDFFGGTWSFYPDPVDFRRYYGGVDLYKDDNAFAEKPGRVFAGGGQGNRRTSQHLAILVTQDGGFANLAVYLLEDFLESTKDPYYAGSFQYGRPMKGHGWQPTTNAELVRTMAKHIASHAPGAEKAQ